MTPPPRGPARSTPSSAGASTQNSHCATGGSILGHPRDFKPRSSQDVARAKRCFLSPRQGLLILVEGRRAIVWQRTLTTGRTSSSAAAMSGAGAPCLSVAPLVTLRTSDTLACTSALPADADLHARSDRDAVALVRRDSLSARCPRSRPPRAHSASAATSSPTLRPGARDERTQPLARPARPVPCTA